MGFTKNEELMSIRSGIKRSHESQEKMVSVSTAWAAKLTSLLPRGKRKLSSESLVSTPCEMK